MRYGMVIDMARCVGCHTCSVACKVANNLPNDIWWNRVLTIGGDNVDSPAGEFSNPSMDYLAVNCQHCENPPCVGTCPVGATFKRSEDGIVVQNYDECIGCRLCMIACPYDVRSINSSKPEYQLDFAIGDADAPAHQPNVVGKCTFCINRIGRGEVPACMELCPTRARFWGDLDNPESDVSKKLQEREVVQLREEMDAKPNIYYLK